MNMHSKIAITAAPTPAQAAIAAFLRTERNYFRAINRSDEATFEAEKTHGKRPSGLIAWRTYSDIGGTELAKARKEFLRDKVASPEVIEAEYLDAKRRERQAEKDIHAWNVRAGVADLVAATERAWLICEAARD